MAWSRRIGLLCLALFLARGSVATSAAVTLTVTPVANIALPNVSVGTAITWTVSVSGGTGPFQFQYWICDSAGWQMMQGYSTSNVFTFVPPRAGEYLLSVYV